MNLIVVACAMFALWAVAVAASDFRYRRVTNALVVAGLAAAGLCAAFARAPFGVSPGGAALGAVVGLLALLPFFALGVMGAADVKVFAVLGAWCGVHALAGLWIAASLAGGVHALWALGATRGPLAALAANRGRTFALGSRRGAPYAAFLTLAALGWLAWLGLAGGVR